jgi:hypothetical protein
MQRMQQGMCRPMASQDSEWFSGITRVFTYGGASKQGATINDRHSIAVAGEVVGGGKAGRASTNYHSGLGSGGRHEDRERIQTPAATASR